MKNILFGILLLMTHICFGQINMFEPNLISDNQVFGIAISPDGKNILYVKAYGGRERMHLYQSQKVNGKWQQPQLAFFADTSVSQIDPSFSPDGNTILYNEFNEDNGYDVYRINKTSSGWAEPERLSDAINTTKHEFYATMANSRNIYFVKRNESNDIYVSYWIDNQYQQGGSHFKKY